MASAIFIGIVGIFIAGAVVGIMIAISLAVGSEQRRCRREQRRFRQDRDSFPDQEGQERMDEFFTDHAPDLLTGGARWMTGLYVRHTRPEADDFREDLLV
jgi:hypothetical protein